MKTRRHHNNKGYRQIKRGKTAVGLKAIAKKLGLKFTVRKVQDGRDTN
jgi:hypothetical protein